MLQLEGSGGPADRPTEVAMTTRYKIALALLAWCLLVPSTKAAACQCGSAPPVGEAVAGSLVVAAGQVTSMSPTTTGVTLGDSTSVTHGTRVTLRIRRVWKGEVDGTMELVVGVSNCDYAAFRVGRTYLVYAGYSSFLPKTLIASRCGRTSLFRPSHPDIARLGSGSSRVDSHPRVP